MGNSLRDELLKAGIVTKKQIRDVDARTRKETRQSRNRKKSERQQQAPAPDSATAVARQSADEQATRDKELNRKREQERSKKALRAQLRDLLDRNRQNDPNGEISHKFVIGSHIKAVYVSQQQHDALNRGELALVYYGKRSHLVPAQIAEKVSALSPNTFIYISKPDEAAADDAYADYKVPDDLIW